MNTEELKQIEELFEKAIAADSSKHTWCWKHQEIMQLSEFKEARYNCLNCKQAIYHEGDCDPL